MLTKSFTPMPMVVAVPRLKSRTDPLLSVRAFVQIQRCAAGAGKAARRQISDHIAGAGTNNGDRAVDRAAAGQGGRAGCAANRRAADCHRATGGQRAVHSQCPPKNRTWRPCRCSCHPG